MRMRVVSGLTWILPFFLLGSFQRSDTPAQPDFTTRLAALEYHASATPRGVQAPNRAQRFRTWFEPTGVRVEPRREPNAGSIALRARSLGRGEARVPLAPG